MQVSIQEGYESQEFKRLVSPLTIQGGIHPADIDKQADHGHDDGRRHVLRELLFEDLAALAALGHCIDVDLSKREPFLAIRVPCEDLLFIVKDQTQELVLNVLSPERNPILFLQMPNLVSRIY